MSGIGYVVLLIGLRVLSPPASARARVGPAREPGRRRRARRLVLPAGRPGLTAQPLSSLATAVFLAFYQPRPVAAATALASLPDRLGSWTTSGLGGSETWWNGADNELRRRYSRGPLGPVDVTVAYFATQRQGRELAGQEAGRLHLAITADEVRLSDGSRDQRHQPDDAGRVTRTGCSGTKSTDSR